MLIPKTTLPKLRKIKSMRSNKPIKTHNGYNNGDPQSPWREALNDVIFGAETRTGKAFDIVLMISIILSVLTVMLDSVESIQQHHAELLYLLEWSFTILFSIEYVLRLICVRRPWLYMRSFYGIVDLISILPTYVSLFIPSAKYLLTLRVLRLLRIFRILKLSEFMGEAHILLDALVNSSRKVMVFLYTVLTLVIVFGSLMYVVEGSAGGFTSIPKSIYWAIVTMTTVGYGDISPQSPIGQTIASIIMILGYGIIAVPTGIYSAELVKTYTNTEIRNDACPGCGQTGHDVDADFCKFCGHQLDE
jgi:voltage-gated potassium channel